MSKAGIQPFLLQTMPMILVTLTPTNTGDSLIGSWPSSFNALYILCLLLNILCMRLL